MKEFLRNSEHHFPMTSMQFRKFRCGIKICLLLAAASFYAISCFSFKDILPCSCFQTSAAAASDVKATCECRICTDYDMIFFFFVAPVPPGSLRLFIH